MFDLMVLATLMCRPCHGYELKRHLASFNPNNNKIYPALRSMREKGYLDVSVEVQDTRPNRNIYSITEAGKEYFRQILSEFDLAKAQNLDEFNLRICFSHLLDKAVIRKILRLRKEAMLLHTPQATLLPPDMNQEDISILLRHHNILLQQHMQFLEEMIEKYQ